MGERPWNRERRREAELEEDDERRRGLEDSRLATGLARYGERLLEACRSEALGLCDILPDGSCGLGKFAMRPCSVAKSPMIFRPERFFDT